MGKDKKECFEKNRGWLQEKAQVPAVMPLAGGVYYRVVKAGDPNIQNLQNPSLFD